MNFIIKNITFIFVILCILDNIVYADSGCCSWHGGQAYCDESVGMWVCNDGTYSPSCECSNIITFHVSDNNDSYVDKETLILICTAIAIVLLFTELILLIDISKIKIYIAVITKSFFSLVGCLILFIFGIFCCVFSCWFLTVILNDLAKSIFHDDLICMYILTNGLNIYLLCFIIKIIKEKIKNE